MVLYEMTQSGIRPIAETTFTDAGKSERSDLQRLLQEQIDVISPDTLIIAEEFGDWEDSRRRIDLLGLDADANLVVIELKRTEDGGHMDLQAIRYAAMVSMMTFDKVTDVFDQYLKSHGRQGDAKAMILEFLDWEEPDVDSFAQEVRIVLASANFSKELTTAVIWLNECGLDIRCIRVKPYADGNRLLLDVQKIIPLPEAESYTVQLKEKQKQERAARQQSLDLTKYDVTVGETTFQRLPKRHAIFKIVQYFCGNGVTPEQIIAAVPWRPNTMFRCVEGEVGSQEFITRVQAKAQQEGKRFEEHRFYCEDADLIKCNGKTYAFTNQWGSRTFEAITDLLHTFPDKGITCCPSS